VAASAAKVVRGVLPGPQEAFLAGDDEPPPPGLEVDDQPLQPVGDHQHLFGLPGPPLRRVQVGHRGQQNGEGGADHQRE
jgi:hypothetical protein